MVTLSTNSCECNFNFFFFGRYNYKLSDEKWASYNLEQIEFAHEERVEVVIGVVINTQKQEQS